MKKKLVSILFLLFAFAGGGTLLSSFITGTVDFARMSLGLWLIIASFVCVFAWMFLDMLENV